MAPSSAHRGRHLIEGEARVELGATIADGCDQMRVVEPERCARIATRRDVGVELLHAGREPLRVAARGDERASVPDQHRAGLEQVPSRVLRERSRGGPASPGRPRRAGRRGSDARAARRERGCAANRRSAALRAASPGAAGRSRRSSRRDGRARSTTPAARPADRAQLPGAPPGRARSGRRAWSCRFRRRARGESSHSPRPARRARVGACMAGSPREAGRLGDSCGHATTYGRRGCVRLAPHASRRSLILSPTA